MKNTEIIAKNGCYSFVDNELYYIMCKEFVYKLLGNIPEKIKITISPLPFKGAIRYSFCPDRYDTLYWINGITHSYIYPALSDAIKPMLNKRKQCYVKVEACEA